MKKLKYWGVAAFTVLLLCVAFWWATSEIKDRKDPLNQSDAFVYSDSGTLYWFNIKSQNGKVEGKLYQRKMIEKVGEPPFMENKKYPLTGKTTEKGYVFKVKSGGKIIAFDAWFSGRNLLVLEQGEKGYKLYKAASQDELDKYVKALQQELKVAIYQSEEKEKSRLKNFFSELNRVYGYMYTAENGQFQLFIKIDEALEQGELAGSLLKMTDTGDQNNPYEESRYALNGITDGIMLEFFTNVDGKKTKLKGNFQKDATGFDLSFWTTDRQLSFHAVTEAEYKQNHDEFRTKVQNRKE